MIERHILPAIQDLSLKRYKMAFISGPRQCGKTTLAKSLLQSQTRYYTWESANFRKSWIKSPELLAESLLSDQSPEVVFDEFHKNFRWKNQLKSFYDQYGDKIKIILTGSAHLNTFRRGADSLMGRFFHFHLAPLCLSEILKKKPLRFQEFASWIAKPEDPIPNIEAKQAVESLFEFGGFPEPWLSQSEEIHRIWSKNRLELLVRQDLRDLSPLINAHQVEILATFLPERVGSPFSVQSVSEDLGVAHTTISRWLGALANLYYHFSITPFSNSISRSLKKEPKIYLYDWSVIADKGNRFENMVACHLLSMCHYYSDTGQADLSLKYLRNKERQEVDFVVLNKGKPLFTVEVKLSELNLDKNFEKFSRHLKVPHFQIVKTEGIFRRFTSLERLSPAYVLSFDAFFSH